MKVARLGGICTARTIAACNGGLLHVEFPTVWEAFTQLGLL